MLESALPAEESLLEDPTRVVRDQSFETEPRRVYHVWRADCVENVSMIRVEVVTPSQKFGPTGLQARP